MYTSTIGFGGPLKHYAFASRNPRNNVYKFCPFGTSARPLRLLTLVKASVEDQWPAPTSYKLWPTEISISSGVYNFVQGSELVAYAALVDAGFSGDWSRIGVLTSDQELSAQQAWWFILVAHSVVAAITVGYALRRGYPPLQAGVRGLLFGTLGLYDVYVRCQSNPVQRS
ncbi:hypothetical protein Vretimale_8246 [Volvox reticuliferus]|uniref:DUF7887 domain-containing protein n=1 Tax=Volvox reticuliferus TaxID=1737510 RepID=A0A8J4CMA0_9CHLO|nr:hypothetical protein Vretifemale_11565 [Volvox reticuliferus]GIM03472.1 hypothetical protein Vretimale_8246 [Volvox reticuliferus]